MWQRRKRTAAVVLGLFLGAGTAHALIARPPTLAEAIRECPLIFVARAEHFDADKATAVFTVGEGLKGKVPYRSLSVNLTGDAEARKRKQTPELLRRLAPGLPVVLFVAQRSPRVIVFAFTNGTWFQMVGGGDAETLRLAFTHFEPYLRRTFKGTTAELCRIIRDALSGKAPPPPLDVRERPGLGPGAPGNFGARARRQQGGL